MRSSACHAGPALCDSGADLEEIAFRVAEDTMFVGLESPHADTWRRQCDNDVHRLLTHLHLLGAITLNDRRAE